MVDCLLLGRRMCFCTLNISKIDGKSLINLGFSHTLSLTVYYSRSPEKGEKCNTIRSF